MKKKSLKIRILALCLIACNISINAQNTTMQMPIDINATNIGSLHTPIAGDTTINQMFKDVDRFRQFDYNSQLVNLNPNNVGDTLLLNFFEDKQYRAVIQRININPEGRTNITSKIVESEFAYCYIVVSDVTISISAELPLNDEYFFASVKNGQAYIGQMRLSELKKDVIEGGEPQIPDLQNNQLENPSLQGDPLNDGGDINDTVTVDVLFVYTQAAEDWALSHYSVTDIHDVITQAINMGNTVMENSKTGITFNVVYRHKTDYVETNTSNDFQHLTHTDDGYMDEVHDLRNVFYADVIVFLADITYTGGTAWLLNNVNGFSNDKYTTAICRVQQSANGYTVVHEIGHNMGCGHSHLQNTQSGPGLFPYSSGWKDTILNTKYCSVMTYENVSYFPGETGNYTRIPFFSSPDTSYHGVPIGNSTTMDNTRTLRETKNVVSAYRTPPTTPTITVNPSELSFSALSTDTTELLAISGWNLSGGISYSLGGADANAFSVSAVQWDTAIGGVLKIAFVATPGQSYHATLTINGGGATSKVVTITYSSCSATSLVMENFDGGNFPPACWTTQGSGNFIWSKVTQGGTNHPSLSPYSVQACCNFIQIKQYLTQNQHY